MSYEGYVQIICANGHLYEAPVGDGYGHTCRCGAKLAWMNHVDQTNNPGDGVIPKAEFVRFELTPEVTTTCTACGTHTHVTEATYRIPTDDETEAMRYDMRYIDGRFEYGRWHRDVADRPVWTPYQPPQVTADGAQEPG